MTIRSIRDLAAAVRGRRKDLGMSQAELASRAKVSRKWIYQFEAGKPTAEFALILQVLDELGLALDVMPRAPSPEGETIDLDAVLDSARRRWPKR